MESVLRGPFTLSKFKHWRKCRDEFEKALAARGVHEYYALVDSLEKFRWCEFLGMKTTLTTIGDTIEIMKREF